jgi:hypothetical protein
MIILIVEVNSFHYTGREETEGDILFDSGIAEKILAEAVRTIG